MSRRVVTREQWLDEGLNRFGTFGLPGLNVEAMAGVLGTSKAGFYWYFKSRAAFERALVEHWRAQETQRIIAAAEREQGPIQKLLRLFSEVIDLRGSADFVFHLRRLARRRKSLSRVLEATEAERIGYLANVLEELGKERGEAEGAAEAVYHLYLGWYERNQFRENTPQEIRKQLRVVSTLVGVDLESASRTGARS
jgi:AcrR family transcriptional regulator